MRQRYRLRLCDVLKSDLLPAMPVLHFAPCFSGVKVVPDALLDFCFNVMRSAFSVTLNRPVYTFNFDRFMDVTPAILDKVSEEWPRLIPKCFAEVILCRV